MIGRTIRERMERFVVVADGEGSCWEWTGTKDPGGYGVLRSERKSILAHRCSWEIANGPIPPGLCVLHHCDNPSCVNPQHLYVGTKADNMRDMVQRHRHPSQQKTHCPKGHEYVPSNTRLTPQGWRKCRACHNETAHRARDLSQGTLA